MTADHRGRMGIEKVDLLLEFIWSCPEIVAFQEGEVSAAARRDSCRHVWKRAEIFFVKQRENDFGVPSLKIP